MSVTSNNNNGTGIYHCSIHSLSVIILVFPYWASINVACHNGHFGFHVFIEHLIITLINF